MTEAFQIDMIIKFSEKKEEESNGSQQINNNRTRNGEEEKKKQQKYIKFQYNESESGTFPLFIIRNI